MRTINKKGECSMGWTLQLVNIEGYVLAEKYVEKENLTTKDIGNIDWDLADGDSLVVSSSFNL